MSFVAYFHSISTMCTHLFSDFTKKTHHCDKCEERFNLIPQNVLCCVFSSHFLVRILSCYDKIRNKLENEKYTCCVFGAYFPCCVIFIDPLAGLRVIIVRRLSFEFVLTDELYQSVESFGSESIFSFSLKGNKFLKKIDITWFSVRFCLCFYH